MQRDDRFSASLMDDGRYRLLVENISDYAVYMLDLNGVITSWNAGAQRFKGYAPHEIIGEHFSRFYSAEDRKAGAPERALATSEREGKFEAEGWRVRKDGSRFWASVIIDPVRDPDGNLVGFAKVTRDLTERKAAERALQVSEQQFRLLVQSVTDYAIYMLDPQGHVTNWNAGAQRIKGYSPDEIIGQHFSKFYTEEDLATGEPDRALQTALREGRFAKEGWRRRKDGTHFWASVVVDPIRSDDGTLVGFAKITRDVTERREAERELERAREALFQSQKMEAIGQLTGGVAHDFNNLLAAILGSLELVQKRLPSDEGRAAPLINNAIAAAKRGAALTQRMLAFARRQDLKPQLIEVHTLIDGMTELVQRSLGPSINFENHVARLLPWVKVDANQMEMALLNLAMNARDAMPNGGSITVDAEEVVISTATAELKPGAYICLAVSDTGEGMDDTTLRKATEPFFTTKGMGKGTGLGLSMVKGLTEQSGGSLKLHSEKGRGTRAELWLPVADAERSSPPGQSELMNEQLRKRKLTVLAVDDDALVLMNTVAMLEELGHTVVEATSATAALETLNADRQVDVVVTDQAMPGMSGLDLARAIQKKWPHIRIVVATGYGELPESSDVCFIKLSKPFMERDLAQALNQVPRGWALGRRIRNLVGL
jgi:PAS domain S-box-containing protein